MSSKGDCRLDFISRHIEFGRERAAFGNVGGGRGKSVGVKEVLEDESGGLGHEASFLDHGEDFFGGEGGEACGLAVEVDGASLGRA